MTKRPGLSRRAALLGLSAAPSVVLAASRNAGAASPEPGACLLTPQSIEGPFYLDPRLVRSNLAEGRPGVPLRLDLRTVEAGPCTPLRGARVDVWHADAQGLYSGYDGQGDRRRISTAGQSFLRGTQVSDGAGAVAFETLYPGWYPGRATHVHFKVFVDSRTLVTGQMYFPDEINDAIYRTEAAYGNRLFKRDTLNANDVFARSEDPRRLGFCTMRREGGAYVASLTVAVNGRKTRG